MDTPRSVMGEATLTGDADGDDKSVTLTLGDRRWLNRYFSPGGTQRWGRHYADIDDRWRGCEPSPDGGRNHGKSDPDRYHDGRPILSMTHSRAPWLSSRSSRHSARCCFRS